MSFLQEYPMISCVAALGLSYLAVAFGKKSLAPRRLYPPGPKGYPILGNLLEMPTQEAWLGYHDMAQIYGDIIYLEAFGKPMLILSSTERLTDLLERRSSNYSGRPQQVMLHELMNYGNSFSLMNYGSWWRRHRRAFHQHFNPTAVPQYHPIITRQVRQYLKKLFNTPNKFDEHTHHLFGSIIVLVTYGVELQAENDPFITDASNVADGFKIAAIPGRFLVDVFPWLKHVPKWMPGARFQRFAEYYRTIEENARNKYFRQVMDALHEGKGNQCVASKLIDDLPDATDSRRREEELIAKNVTFLTYLAGSDTSSANGMAFILAMAMHPECQRKAQIELDSVVGHGHIPDFSHRHQLVYVNAIIKELLRWYQVTPLGNFHLTMEDDTYDGYFIPKGTVVIGNAWSILHNPKTFPNPMEFDPERYIKDGKLDQSVPDSFSVAFGFGRRICPGRHLALESLFLVVASTLALFDIHPPQDEFGQPIQLEAKFADGLLMHPEPFQCIFKPRSPDIETILRGL